MEFCHKPVLLQECIEGLNIKPNGIYVDGTIGGAGHSTEILKRLGKDGLLIGIDRDLEALAVVKERLKEFNNVKLIHGNHDDIKEDILDMRMDKTQELTAKTIVNSYPEEKLANIIYEFGEERFSRQIAKAICKYRENKEIVTTGELAKIIEKAVPFYNKKEGHPAKRTFQAIRIEVNDEIKPLYNTVRNSIDCLKQNGRICIITFHSIEDRAVKNAYEDAKGKCTCPPDLPYCVCGVKSIGKVINRKPIIATKEEIEENSRAKSAKLRIFEKN